MTKKEPLKLMPLEQMGKLLGQIADKPKETSEKSVTEQPKRKRTKTS